jgi:hypothetical protein
MAATPYLDRIAHDLQGGADVVVSAVNDNPRYLDVVPWWFDFWDTVGPRARRPIKPWLLAVNVKPDSVPAQFSDRVIAVDVGQDVSSALAAQVLRIIWPATLPDLPGRVITTDIDMLPLSTSVFDHVPAEIDSKFYILRDVLVGLREIPICYNAATPTVWKSVMGTDVGLASALDRHLQGFGPYTGIRGGVGWSIDQSLLFSRIASWELAGGDVVRFADSDTGHRRLDRARSALFPWVVGPVAARRGYTDYHVHLPVTRFGLMLKWLKAWL